MIDSMSLREIMIGFFNAVPGVTFFSVAWVQNRRSVPDVEIETHTDGALEALRRMPGFPVR